MSSSARSCMLLPVVLLVLLSARVPAHADSRLERLSWRADSASRRALEEVPPAEIATLLNALLEPTNEKIGREPGTLGTYAFVDLDRDGTLELVATLDFSGRAFFSQLVVVRRDVKGFSQQELSGFNITDVSTAIRDLDNDGRKELVITRLFGRYRGATPTALWTDVYQWDGRSYVQSNSKFRPFYEKRVEELKHLIVGSQDSHWRDAYTIELEKAQRLLNRSSAPGLETALRLYASPDVDARLNAIKILEDIASAEAAEALMAAENDPEPIVKQAASQALDSMSYPREKRR